MTKIIFSLFLVTFNVLFFSCSKSIEKPQVTIGEYTIQYRTSKGVIDKILNEPDYKKMHEMALAIESSRAIKCVLVTDECNVLEILLNKIVKSTVDGPPGPEANIAIYKLAHQLDEEFQKGYEKLGKQWKEYISASSSKDETVK